MLKSYRLKKKLRSKPEKDAEDRQNIENTLTDFVDFKRYVTDSLGMLDRKIEKYQSSFEIKDLVIKLLREELKTAQENLKFALEQNSFLSKQLSQKESYTKDTVCFSEMPEVSENIATLDEVIDDIPFDKSFISTHNDPLKDMKEKDQLSQIRSRNHKLFLSKKSEKIATLHTKTYDIKNQNNTNQKKMSIVGGFLSKNTTKDLKDSIHSKNVQTSQTSQENSRRKDLIVCGDSMLNNVEGNGVSTKSIKSIVRSFPGADSTDMIDYLKPLLKKKKPKYLILHVGTNDLTSGCDTVKNLEKIREMIQQITPETELIISKVIIREDKKEIQSKVNGINQLLHDFCEKYNLYVVSHDNITRKMLSKKKLHLNGTGISRFAQNLKEFITENC